MDKYQILRIFGIFSPNAGQLPDEKSASAETKKQKNTETLTKEKSSRKPTRYAKKETKDGNSNGREESPKTYKVHK